MVACWHQYRVPDANADANTDADDTCAWQANLSTNLDKPCQSLEFRVRARSFVGRSSREPKKKSLIQKNQKRKKSPPVSCFFFWLYNCCWLLCLFLLLCSWFFMRHHMCVCVWGEGRWVIFGLFFRCTCNSCNCFEISWSPKPKKRNQIPNLIALNHNQTQKKKPQNPKTQKSEKPKNPKPRKPKPNSNS